MFSLLPHISLLCLILLSNTALATSAQDQLPKPSPLTENIPLYHIEAVVDTEKLEELLQNWVHEDHSPQIITLEKEELEKIKRSKRHRAADHLLIIGVVTFVAGLPVIVANLPVGISMTAAGTAMTVTATAMRMGLDIRDNTPLHRIEAVVDAEKLEELLQNWNHENHLLQIITLEKLLSSP